MAGLSKSRITQHRQCPKRLWLSVNRPELSEQDDSVAVRMSAGNRVGEIVRELYPGGILIDSLKAKQALADTVQALSGKRRPIFEAAFAVGGVLVRLDLLLPFRGGGYRMVEVKSSTQLKEYHLEDAAIQACVARLAGLPVRRVEIAHIDNSFVFPGNEDYQGLFTHVDISKKISPLEKEVPKWVKDAMETLACDEPASEPGERCREPFVCPFSEYCNPRPAAGGYPLTILPHISGRILAAKLSAAGYDDLRKVPKAGLTAPKHQRIWRVTKSGKPELDPEAGEEMAARGYPRFYLDFETIDFAVPIWAGTRPYRQIPFQWSCHIERKTGAIEHKEFLAAGSADPRRDFAEELIKAMKARGPVFVYNASFEAGRLKELAADFPELAPKLNAICNRFVDLLPMARNYYYHREMRGSWSLKAVLPTIAPELAYDDLEVADGGMAQEAFMEILDPKSEPNRIRTLRKNLLAYCARDTLALVKLAHFFEKNKKGGG